MSTNGVNPTPEGPDVQVSPELVDFITSYSKCSGGGCCTRPGLGLITRIGVAGSLVAVAVAAIFCCWAAVDTKRQVWNRIAKPVLLGQGLQGVSPRNVFMTDEERAFLASVTPRDVFFHSTNSRMAPEYLARARAFAVAGDEANASLNYKLVDKCSGAADVKTLAAIELASLNGVTPEARKKFADFMRDLAHRNAHLGLMSTSDEAQRLFVLDELAQQTAQHLMMRGEMSSELPCSVTVISRARCADVPELPEGVPLPPVQSAPKPATKLDRKTEIKLGQGPTLRDDAALEEVLPR